MRQNLTGFLDKHYLLTRALDLPDDLLARAVLEKLVYQITCHIHSYAIDITFPLQMIDNTPKISRISNGVPSSPN